MGIVRVNLRRSNVFSDGNNNSILDHERARQQLVVDVYKYIRRFSKPLHF